MQVYGTQVIESDTTVKLNGPYGGQQATVIHYEAETYPCTYTVELADGTIERGVAHACIEEYIPRHSRLTQEEFYDVGFEDEFADPY